MDAVENSLNDLLTVLQRGVDLLIDGPFGEEVEIEHGAVLAGSVNSCEALLVVSE